MKQDTLTIKTIGNTELIFPYCEIICNDTLPLNNSVLSKVSDLINGEVVLMQEYDNGELEKIINEDVENIPEVFIQQPHVLIKNNENRYTIFLIQSINTIILYVLKEYGYNITQSQIKEISLYSVFMNESMTIYGKVHK